MMCRGQYVTQHNGKHDVVIDVSIPAIKAVMDAYGVKDQKGCLQKVRRTFHYFLGERDEG